MARSLNKVQLIGNLTRDPELRYTPQGTAVCTFGMATNRQWKTEAGEMRDEAEFHRIVAWNQLAEICARMLKKGSRVFVEGRIQSRTWTGQDNQQRTTFEIVISDMILLDSRRTGEVEEPFADIPEDLGEVEMPVSSQSPEVQGKEVKSSKNKKPPEEKDESLPDDNEEEIPF